MPLELQAAIGVFMPPRYRYAKRGDGRSAYSAVRFLFHHIYIGSTNFPPLPPANIPLLGGLGAIGYAIGAGVIQFQENMMLSMFGPCPTEFIDMGAFGGWFSYFTAGQFMNGISRLERYVMEFCESVLNWVNANPGDTQADHWKDILFSQLRNEAARIEQIKSTIITIPYGISPTSYGRRIY